MNFINSISWWQWLILAAIPPAIVALYFLKLRRAPLEVPSTYLWRQTIEDLHVNSLWQRLRRNILLLLQLLLIFLVMFALLRPGWQSEGVVGNRLVILIDNSASMNSEDVEPTRLEEAKRRAAEIIDDMKSGDRAMIIAFNDRAIPVQQFTSNKRGLARKLTAIQPTHRTSAITEALRLASGMANPNGAADDDTPADESPSATPAADEQPAALLIFTDGRFEEVSDINLDNLAPQYVIIGQPQPGNVGITAFNVARNEEQTQQLQAICRIENFGPEEVEKVQVSLYLNDETAPRDAAEISLVDGVGGYPFDLTDMDSGVLRVKLDHNDDFAGDNVAFAAINAPRRANVLLVTPGNDALVFACKTLEAEKAAHIMFEAPSYLDSEQYEQRVQTAAYDLIIYDQCAPKELPQANTLFIGSLPPETKELETEPGEPNDEADPAEAGDQAAGESAKRREHWQAGPPLSSPAVIDTDRTHPLMRYIELGNVRIAEARPLVPPSGGTALIDADIGVIFAVAPRKTYEDAVLGFEIIGSEDGQRYANTDWPVRRSFPLFVMNALHYLGGQSGALSTGSVQPGKTIEIRTDTPAVTQVTVEAPDGERTRIDRRGQATFPYSKTDEPGVYEVSEGKSDQPQQRFAVNLFDPNESNIVPREELQVGETVVTGQRQWEPMRFELWKWILLGGLGLLVAEWWIWNRRVYI